MATIKDVARVSGVSVATVSRVVNNGPKVSDKARKKVTEAMNQLGYRPNANAIALVTQKSTTIGVIIPSLTDPFFAALAAGVEKVARQRNMQLLLSTGQVDAESERQALNLLLERRCDAIVMHSKTLPDDELIKLSNSTPGLVLIDRYIEQISERCVWLDNYEGGTIAARHLLSLGHKAIACISSQYQIDDPVLRLSGFTDELAKSSFNKKQLLIVYEEPNQLGGEIATQKLLAAKQPFSAIFVYNDAMALGAISTLEDNGFKVPEDVSVIGFDDVLLARYSRPKLTTLHYPIGQMAENAAELCLALKGDKHTKDQTSLQYTPRLVKRASTIAKPYSAF